jgi:hypothetical protein
LLQSFIHNINLFESSLPQLKAKIKEVDDSHYSLSLNLDFIKNQDKQVFKEVIDKIKEAFTYDFKEDVTLDYISKYGFNNIHAELNNTLKNKVSLNNNDVSNLINKLKIN